MEVNSKLTKGASTRHLSAAKQTQLDSTINWNINWSFVSQTRFWLDQISLVPFVYELDFIAILPTGAKQFLNRRKFAGSDIWTVVHLFFCLEKLIYYKLRTTNNNRPVKALINHHKRFVSHHDKFIAATGTSLCDLKWDISAFCHLTPSDGKIQNYTLPFFSERTGEAYFSLHERTMNANLPFYWCVSCILYLN